MRILADRLIQPLLSEKSSQKEQKLNEYHVVVERKLTKTEIFDAVEKIFGTRPLSVRTSVFRKKVKRNKFGEVPARSYKKALIRMPEGSRIEFK